MEHFERKYDLCAIRLDLPFVHKALDFYFASMEVPGVAPPIHAMTELDVRSCRFIFATFMGRFLCLIYMEYCRKSLLILSNSLIDFKSIVVSNVAHNYLCWEFFAGFPRFPRLSIEKVFN